MTEYDFVFVLLVYRNTADIEEFLKTLENVKGRCKLVVVNSFYDQATRVAIEKLCEDNNCDFINAENRGYGCGNNTGIEFAREHYTFKYLIVSNPDIVILDMPDDILMREAAAYIYGPVIKTLSGKRQNPCMVIYSPFREFLMKRFALRPRNTFPFYLAIAFNKIERIIFNTFFSRCVKKVYSLHGSFMIFTNEALTLLGEPFNPRMFLFREEDYIARRAKSLGIKMIYYPFISVLHKEDGSVKFVDGSVRAHTIDSLREYFGLR